MKKYLLLLLLYLPVLTYAQRTFKFAVVDALTGKPMAQKWIIVLQNNKNAISFAATDSSGIYTFNVADYNSKDTFRAEIHDSWNNHLQYQSADISAAKIGIPIVKVKSSKYTFPYGCGTVSYSNYDAAGLSSLQQLPAFIQAAVKRHLVKRVGDNFYQRLKLNGGQLVDLDTFYRLNPKIKKRDWQPPSYDLCFMVWDSVAHESLYTFRLQLDAKGNLQKSVPLPDILHHPAKARILTLNEAMMIAQTQGFAQPYVQTETQYNFKAKSIVWQFNYTDPGVGYLQGHILLFDAHTGAVVERRLTDVWVN